MKGFVANIGDSTLGEVVEKGETVLISMAFAEEKRIEEFDKTFELETRSGLLCPIKTKSRQTEDKAESVNFVLFAVNKVCFLESARNARFFFFHFFFFSFIITF